LSLAERLPAALTVLAWLDALILPEDEDGASVIDLPSASHVEDQLPAGWKAE
jgi:hypothetical protein